MSKFQPSRKAPRPRDSLPGATKLWHNPGFRPEGRGSEMLLLIVVLILVFGLGGGYYGHSRWGAGGGAGVGLGTILLICVLVYLVGGFR
jgi:hypothetical protein